MAKASLVFAVSMCECVYLTKHDSIVSPSAELFVLVWACRGSSRSSSIFKEVSLKKFLSYHNSFDYNNHNTNAKWNAYPAN